MNTNRKAFSLVTILFSFTFYITASNGQEVFDPDAPPETRIKIAPYLTFGAQIEVESELERNIDLDGERDEDLSAIAPELSMDILKREVTRGDRKIILQPREYALLEYLMRNIGRVVSKTIIMEHVYDYDFDPQTNVVDVLVCRLRDKVDRDFEKKMIHTIRGVGYVLKES